MKKAYDIINYFDVWGNRREGWEVNNQARWPVKAQLDPEAQDFKLAVMKALKKAGYMKVTCRKASFVIDWNCSDSEHVEIEQPNGYPVCRLEMSREEAL